MYIYLYSLSLPHSNMSSIDKLRKLKSAKSLLKRQLGYSLYIYHLCYIHTSLILYSYLTHAIFIPHSCYIHTSLMLYPYLTHATFIPHSCYIHTSLMLYPYLTHAISIPHSCYIHTSLILYSYLTHAISIPHSCYIHTSLMLYSYLTHTIFIPHSCYIHTSLMLYSFPSISRSYLTHIPHLYPFKCLLSCTHLFSVMKQNNVWKIYRDNSTEVTQLRPHLSIIQISKSDWSEGPITFRVGHVKDKFNPATGYI